MWETYRFTKLDKSCAALGEFFYEDEDDRSVWFWKGKKISLCITIYDSIDTPFIEVSTNDQLISINEDYRDKGILDAIERAWKLYHALELLI